MGKEINKKGFSETLIRIIGIIIAVFFELQLYSSDIQLQYSNNSGKKSFADESRAPGFCTIFCISKGESVFFGNNEDWKNPNTYCWVEQASDSTYGAFYLGFEGLFPQGGINEKGLAFDANALPGIKLKEHPELLKPYLAIVNKYVMQRCATVEEAIEMAKSYDWSQSFGGILNGQYLLADATGDAVVISADQDGEIVFTRKQPGDGFLVSTNFNRAYPENKFGRGRCRRYETASGMLDEIMKRDAISSVLLVNVLDAVHEEGNKLNTLYSNIFDLKQGIVYLYYWHQFDHGIVINVADWIQSKPVPVRIEALFSEETVDQANKEHQRYRSLKNIFIIVFLLIIAALILIVLKRNGIRIKKAKPE